MHNFYRASITPAILLALLSSTTAAAFALIPAPSSRLEFNGTQCVRIPSLTVGTASEVVDCSAYVVGNDVSLRFVFVETLIKLYQDQTLCAGWIGGLIAVEICDPNAPMMQFVWITNGNLHCVT
jgi:hypothetical protein